MRSSIGLIALAILTLVPGCGSKTAEELTPFPAAKDGSCPEGTSLVGNQCIGPNQIGAPYTAGCNCLNPPCTATTYGRICSDRCTNVGEAYSNPGLECLDGNYGKFWTLVCDPQKDQVQCPKGLYCKPAVNVTGSSLGGYCEEGGMGEEGSFCGEDVTCEGKLICRDKSCSKQ